MSMEELQKQTNTNVQEKANLIWDIATHLYGQYKPHEYGRVILPMTVIKRFDDSLKDTKAKVLEVVKRLDESGVTGMAREAILKKTSGRDFYNVSRFDFEKLLADSANIAENFVDYLQGFSDNVKDIISYFEFDKEISKMSQNDLLFTIIQEFNSKKGDMSPDKVSSQDMGYIFEELVRKFSESYDEQAGAHFTARDIIYLMTELLIAPEKDEIKANGCSKTAYDMAMGTSQMLACLDERLHEVNKNSVLKCFGQEFNPETFAIAKADMLIKGGDAENMKFGDTLSDDQFENYTFDYIISNPPFGIDWKKEQTAVTREAKLGFDGRFGPGLPSISDGQMLFLLNGVKKLKETGRMAIIQNGSSLFTGDAGSGTSEIRRYLFENDLVESIIQLPNDLFYNTGLATFIWVITPSKSSERIGKTQLIDANSCFEKRNRPIGSKKVDLTRKCIEMILGAYSSCKEESVSDGDLSIESKWFDNQEFGYAEYAIEQPQVDENGKIIISKGKPIPDKSLRDFEDIPLNQDPKEYFENNIKPFNSAAWMDEKSRIVGYQVPFTRVFYRFKAPENSDSIYERLKEETETERKMMEEIL